MRLRGVLGEFGFHYQEPTTLYADNQGAIALMKDPKYHKKTKHIAVPYHFTRELIEQGVINLHWLPTNELKADGLTKALPPTKFSRFIELIGFELAGHTKGEYCPILRAFCMRRTTFSPHEDMVKT